LPIQNIGERICMDFTIVTIEKQDPGESVNIRGRSSVSSRATHSDLRHRRSWSLRARIAFPCDRRRCGSVDTSAPQNWPANV